jgi:hypothetical protein
MGNNNLISALFIFVVASVTASHSAYCQSIGELQKQAEGCGRESYNVIYTAFREESLCKKKSDSGRCDFLGIGGLTRAKSFTSRCVEKFADEQKKPWFYTVLECEMQHAAAQRFKENPDDLIAKETLHLLMVNKFQCNPLPTPEESLKEQKIHYDSLKTPILVSPRDGAKIVWAITKGGGIGTIHLGISLSDKSFWRYVYGFIRTSRIQT